MCSFVWFYLHVRLMYRFLLCSFPVNDTVTVRQTWSPKDQATVKSIQIFLFLFFHEFQNYIHFRITGLLLI